MCRIICCSQISQPTLEGVLEGTINYILSHLVTCILNAKEVKESLKYFQPVMLFCLLVTGQVKHAK